MHGTLTTDSFNSNSGMTSQDGSVGVRTRMTATTFFNIGGSLWVAGLDGAQQPVLQIGGSNVVTGEMHVGGDLAGPSFLDVGADAHVAGGIDGTLFGTIAGTLRVPSAAAVAGTTTASSIQVGPVSVADPCNCEDPLDIDGIVSGFEHANDNAASGIGDRALVAPAGFDLTLDCGRYYFKGANIGATAALHLSGRTAIFVDGDFEATALLSIDLAPGADLDLFVTGNVVLNGVSEFGYRDAPARIRMYVGGERMDLVSLATLGANIYARRATVNAQGTLAVWGSLYCDRLETTALAEFHYDSAILEIEGCDPPDQPCESCNDCGSASCAAGQCGGCTSNADCCAPLVCREGACQLLTVH